MNNKIIINKFKKNIKVFGGKYMKYLKFFSILFILIFLGNCNKKPAENVARKFYENIRNKNYKVCLLQCSDELFKITPKKDFLKLLQTINKKLGNLKSYKLINWNINSYVGNKNSGTTYVLIYNVEYTKFSAKEKLTLFKPKGSNDLKIKGYYVTSNGFLDEK